MLDVRSWQWLELSSHCPFLKLLSRCKDPVYQRDHRLLSAVGLKGDAARSMFAHAMSTIRSATARYSRNAYNEILCEHG